MVLGSNFKTTTQKNSMVKPTKNHNHRERYTEPFVDLVKLAFIFIFENTIELVLGPSVGGSQSCSNGVSWVSIWTQVVVVLK